MTIREQRLAHLKLPASAQSKLETIFRTKKREFALQHPELSDKQIEEQLPAFDTSAFQKSIEGLREFRFEPLGKFKDLTQQASRTAGAAGPKGVEEFYSSALEGVKPHAQNLLSILESAPELLNYIPPTIFGETFQSKESIPAILKDVIGGTYRGFSKEDERASVEREQIGREMRDIEGLIATGIWGGLGGGGRGDGGAITAEAERRAAAARIGEEGVFAGSAAAKRERGLRAEGRKTPKERAREAFIDGLRQEASTGDPNIIKRAQEFARTGQITQEELNDILLQSPVTAKKGTTAYTAQVPRTGQPGQQQAQPPENGGGMPSEATTSPPGTPPAAGGEGVPQEGGTGADLDPDSRITRSASSSAMRNAAATDPAQKSAAMSQDAAMGFEEYDNAIDDFYRIRGMQIRGAAERDADAQRYFQQWADRYDRIDGTIQSVLENVRNRSVRAIEEERMLADRRLEWQKESEMRQQKRRMTEEIEQAENTLAITGAGWSPNALMSVRKFEMEWEENISNLAMAYDFKRADLAMEFTKQYNAIEDNYLVKSIEASERHLANLERIDGQSFASTQARMKAEEDANVNYMKSVNETRLKKAEAIRNDVIEMMKLTDAQEKQLRSEERADERQRISDDRAERRIQMQLDSAERSQMNTTKNAERASSDDIRAQFKALNQNPAVQKYYELRSASRQMNNLLTDAIQSGDPTKLGVAKTISLTLTAKASDPTTGVRPGELENFKKGTTWVNNVLQAGRAIMGGDLTGLSTESVKAYTEAVQLLVDSQHQDSLSYIQPVLHSLISHNNRSEYLPLSPADVLPPEFLMEATEAWEAYTSAKERIGEGYNFQWEPMEGGGNEFGNRLSSIGRITQSFDTPIQPGTLYSQTTVQAWGGIHAGIDIAIPQGTDFQSLVGGRVKEIGNEAGWGGTIIVVDPNGAEHRISHLSFIDPSIKVGEVITKGQVIGKTGGAKGTQGAGTSTGAHIDYRIRYKGRYINPLQYHA